MDQKLKLSAKAIGEYRAVMVCCWAYRWLWSNAANIARVAGVNRQRYADELVDRGFLIRLKSGPGHPDRFVYILSDTGRQLAAFELDRLGDYLPPLTPYSLTEHQRVPMTLHAHNMVAQEIVLRLAYDQLGSFPLWSTDIEERRLTDIATCADAVDQFTHSSELDWSDFYRILRLHEVELNQKTRTRLLHWLGLRILRLKECGEGRAYCCVWSATNAIIDSYQQALSKPIPQYYRTAAGGLSIDQSKPYLHAEQWMFRFFKLQRDRVSGAWHPEDRDLASLIG